MNHINCASYSVPINLVKLHRTILAMSCMLATAHANYFAVVVRFAYIVCSSICFFPDRITKWCCEIRWVLWLFLDNLTRQAIHLYSCLSLWPPGSSLVPIFGYAYCYPWVAFLSRILSTCSPKQNHITATPLLLPVVWCLFALRVVGMLRFCCLSRSDIGICWEVDTWLIYG